MEGPGERQWWSSEPTGLISTSERSWSSAIVALEPFFLFLLDVLLPTREGREEDKNKGKKERGRKREKEKQPPNVKGTPGSLESWPTRQGPLNKSASKAIAVHTAEPVIHGGWDELGPLINWDIAPYLCIVWS